MDAILIRDGNDEVVKVVLVDDGEADEAVTLLRSVDEHRLFTFNVERRIAGASLDAAMRWVTRENDNAVEHRYTR